MDDPGRAGTPTPAAPAVSAVMAVRNRAHLMDAAISSVLAQDDPDFELIIVDDGSSDRSWVLAQQWARRDPRIWPLRMPRPSGISAVRNRALAVARGEYLATCDSDDLCRPHRFRVLRNYLDARPDAVGAGGGIRCFTDDPDADGWLPDWNFGLRDARIPFPFPASLLRTRAVRRVGGYDETLPVAEDLDLAYRLATIGELAMLPDVVVDYRIHPGNVSAQRRIRERANLRAQLRGLRSMRGRFSPRGYLVLGQSFGRVIASGIGRSERSPAPHGALPRSS